MLALRDLTKTYGDRTALNAVSFDVRAGRMTGFIGGNGAGKTTTMRIVLGVLTPDSGTVSLHGRPATGADRRRFGYMPEERGLYPKMRIREQIVYLARLYGHSAADATEQATAILTRLGLAERLDDPVESLSLGNQQRAQLAAALVHDPEVLILDEPFSGLDPLAVDAIAEVLQERTSAGTAVLFSSHQLDLVERFCDDLVIISAGGVRASGSREELHEQHASLRYELFMSGDTGWLRGEPGIEVLTFDGGYAGFAAEDEAAAAHVLRHATERGEVTGFIPQRPSLTEIFKEVIR